MTIPSIKNPEWRFLIEGSKKYPFTFLGLKMLLGNLTLKYKNNPKEEVLEACTCELQEFFRKNMHLPKVKKDFTLVFGKKVVE